ncbi:MAG: hypothetical protein ABIP13_02365 [Tepidiformaceae bacterium]
MPRKQAEIGWARITYAKARVLAGLEDQQTEQRIADGLNVALSTIRSHVEELKATTGCGDIRELGKWRRQNRSAWLAWCEAQASSRSDGKKTQPPVG